MNTEEEKIDILDEGGNKTGEVKLKSEVHKTGDWHRTVHVWFLNSKNQLLVQKRSPKKKNHPNMWDISVAGHVSAGQTSIEGALRETQEEIGISIQPTDLQYLFTIKNHGKERLLGGEEYRDNEFQDVYLVNKDLDLSKLTLEWEVEEVKFIEISELKDWMSTKKKDVVMHSEEYKRLLEALG